MDRQLKVSLESSVTLVTPEGSNARLLLEKYGISSILALGWNVTQYPEGAKLINIHSVNSWRVGAPIHCI